MAMGVKRTRARPQRLQIAKHWIPTYKGTKIIKGYKKKFAVDTLVAIRDLQELGVPFKPEYLAAVEATEKNHLLQRQFKKQERLAEQHELERLYDEMSIWDDVFGGSISDSINITDNHRTSFENKIGSVKKAGKNHVKVNGTWLQTNKKWSQLKQKQRDWIYGIIKTEYKQFVEEANQLPMKTGKKKLITTITARIDERNIWLPSDEMEYGISKYIDRLNRKTALDDE
jgi:hypothetical protein